MNPEEPLGPFDRVYDDGERRFVVRARDGLHAHELEMAWRELLCLVDGVPWTTS